MIGRRHSRLVENVAPYALGALSAEEAKELEAHLPACAECRHELAELGSGVDALARSVEQLEPPAALRARVLERLAADSAAAATEATVSERADEPSEPEQDRGRRHADVWAGLRARAGRRRAGRPASGLARPAVALAAGIVALGAGGLAGWALRGGAERELQPRTVAASIDHNRMPSVRGHLTIPPGGDPTLRLSGLHGLGPERSYELWVQRHGEIAPGPVFEPTTDGSASMGIPGRPEEIDAVYVTREREGGSAQPTEAPIVEVSMRR